MVYFEAVEVINYDNKTVSITLSKSREENFTRKLKSKEEALELINQCIESRKREIFTIRNSNDEVVKKISFYDRYNITYKINKVIEEKENLYEFNNNVKNQKLKDLQEELSI